MRGIARIAAIGAICVGCASGSKPPSSEDSLRFRFGDACLEADAEDGNRDGDRIAGAADHCPCDAEDVDAFEDDDGCPDFDNDRDGLADGSDRCPIAAENINAVADDDGCPDADSPDLDGDGVPNENDVCSDPEDRDGVEDTDGCPEP